ARSGHRDTGYTDCPGNALSAGLPAIAQGAAAPGLPKTYAPAVSGNVEGLVRFTARLSAALPWTVTVTSAAGVPVGQGTGTGAKVDWTWDATLAPPGRYTWTIAVPDALSATGSIGAAAAAVALQNAKATPAVLAPGGDPADDTTTITHKLTAAATVTVTLLDPTLQPVTTLL